MNPIPKIRIVDDEVVAIQVLRNALKDMGEMSYATSGEDALALVAEEPVDLVLLDARMPGLDGFDTCRALHNAYPDLPVIFVTAASDFASEIRALEAGALDFISKPINPPVVRARVGVHLKLKAHGDLLRALSSRDPLTGIANRRALEERLDQEWRRNQRQRQPLSLLMMDIDHFKAYNDLHGHIAGDDCLRRVAQAIEASVTRASDLVARYGGEEFVALLAGASRKEATALGEKILAAVRALAIPHGNSSAGPIVTLSIGVATCVPGWRHSAVGHPAAIAEATAFSGPPTRGAEAAAASGPPAAVAAATATSRPPAAGAAAFEPPTAVSDAAVSGPAETANAPAGPIGLLLAHDLFDRADKALYQAKEQGRNQLCVADE